MHWKSWKPLALAGGIIGCVQAGGCAAPSYSFADRTASPAIPGASLAAEEPEALAQRPRDLPMYAGYSGGGGGTAIDWSDLQQGIAWADVIIVGEEHDDAVGHAVEQAIVYDVVSQYARAALSMEMLERDEQPVVDDYLEGIIDAQTLEKLTLSKNWGGEGKWVAWYQPMIECAKEHNARIVAANAPRRYVRLARTDGYDRLRALPPGRRKLFDLPGELKDQGYVERFIEVMSEDGHESTNVKRTQAEIEEIMGAQLVWDATMGASIAKAKRGGASKVVHIVGQFHCDNNGGTVQELRRRLPTARILTITMQREDGGELREEDRNRADVVIYTGKRPPESPEPPESQPAESQPAESQPAGTPSAASQPQGL